MTTYYQIWVNSDMTEGRGPMRPWNDGVLYETEQDAWDACNTKPGVMGRSPVALKRGVRGWQDWHRVFGYSGDYEVRPFVLTIKKAEPQTKARALVKELGLKVGDLSKAAEAANTLAETLAAQGHCYDAGAALEETRAICESVEHLKEVVTMMTGETGLDARWSWED